MSDRKDKAKVLGERFDDERIKSFLNVAPVPGVDTNFLALERAYRGMVAEDFAKFVAFYRAEGRPLDPCNARGESFRAILRQHRHSGDYMDALESADQPQS